MEFPQPLHCLQEMKTPLFLAKTYEMVDDQMTNDVVSWSSGRNSFIVWDAHMLASDILPRYFKHDHFSSFIRQLNFYGFRKIGGAWEFAHEYFLAGQKHLLNSIQRKKYQEKLMKKKQQSQSHMQSRQENDVSFVELVQSEQTLKLHKLKNERKMLAQENSQLRKQLLAIEKKLNTLTKQHQTMSFLVRALGKPTFVQQIIRRTEQVKQIKSSKKKRTVSASTNEEDIRAIEEVKNELTLEGSSNIEGDNVGNLEIAINALSNELMVGLSGLNQYEDFGERLLEWNEHLKEVLDHEWDVSFRKVSIEAEHVI